MKFRGLTARSLLAVAPAAAPDTLLCPGNGAGLHQLRVYEVDRANREAFHARFQNHALRIMKKNGFEVLDLWESDAGEKLQFVYLLAWPDSKTMERAWKAFFADQEWIDIKRRTAALPGERVESALRHPLARVS